MFNIGGGELLVIVLVALIVLGPQRLPDAIRTFGRVLGEVRRLSTGFQQELRDALEDSEIDDSDTGPKPRRPATPPASAAAGTTGGEAVPEQDADNGAADGDRSGTEAVAAGGDDEPATTLPDGARETTGNGQRAEAAAPAGDDAAEQAEMPGPGGDTAERGDERAAS